MLALRKNEDGYIWAYILYHVVNEDGTVNLKGKYCFVQDCWVHPKHRNNLKQIVKEEHSKYPTVEHIYYQQRKYNKRWKMHKVKEMYGRR
jgi:hypothetical protein